MTLVIAEIKKALKNWLIIGSIISLYGGLPLARGGGPRGRHQALIIPSPPRGRHPVRIVLTPPRKAKLFEGLPHKIRGWGSVVVSRYSALNSSSPEVFRNPPPPFPSYSRVILRCSTKLGDGRSRESRREGAQTSQGGS